MNSLWMSIAQCEGTTNIFIIIKHTNAHAQRKILSSCMGNDFLHQVLLTRIEYQAEILQSKMRTNSFHKQAYQNVHKVQQK